ncbi:hypothetical protein C3E80_13925 [Cronobacter malonaticus]|uniref:Uncharacterized protein n=1 Tax=Cronobacter malonaticus TaxID=413503 RepID=A0A423XSJ0_9ENTR|nr:hypothetical protein [Cronobacter malonaticus]ROW59500.1 hypothetical protein C3E80_13925 [Cronobacter malonaticus]RRA41301.1 hypothetical protein C4882_09740 [Cronobacter malonaticus]
MDIISIDFFPIQGGMPVSQTCYAQSFFNDAYNCEVFEIYISEVAGGGIKDKATGKVYVHIAIDENGLPQIYDAALKKPLMYLSERPCTIDGEEYSR